MKFFDEYFVFSSSEKRGIYLFLLLIFLLCLVYLAIPHFMKPDKTDFSELINTLEKNKAQEKTQISKIILFNFNPNTISKDSLELLGFTSKQAWNTINFREKVKPFETKKDLRKLYAMTDSLYQSIERYILLKNEQTDKQWTEKQNLSEKKFFNL